MNDCLKFCVMYVKMIVKCGGYMNKFNAFLKPYQKQIRLPLVLLSVLSIVMSLSAVIFAYMSKLAIDEAFNSGDRFFFYAVILVLILLAQLLAQALNHYYKAYVHNKLYERIQKDYYQHLLSGVLPDVQKEHAANYIHLFKADLQMVTESVSDILPKIIFYVVRFTGAFIVLFILSDLFALLFLGLGILLFLLSRLIRKPIFETHQQALKQETLMYTYMTDTLSHLEVIKAFEREDTFLNHLDGMAHTLTKKRMKKTQISVFTSLGLNAFFAFGYAFSIIFGAYQIGLGLLSIGALTAIIQLVQNIQSPFSGLSTIMPKYYQMLGSMDRLEHIKAIHLESKVQTNIQPFNTLLFDHVSFSYPDKPVIKHLSFEIKQKDIVWVKGASGIGKTTLLKLLLGYLTPSEGNIQLVTTDHMVPITSNTRSYFSYVPQSPFILNDTILENLTLKAAVDPDLVKKACIQANIYEDILSLNNGFDTLLGENGIGLSLGQLQRLSIARALIKNSPVLLLDEITASLDTKAEQDIYDTLKTLKDKTLIIVSHKNIQSLNPDLIIDINKTST
ncbi:MAG: hypothetical protein CVV63_01305 [Tenericutes bacterium HGW-Tenericutes-8]|nr:MAG: hypothetical protein CVV63_01305 [Tenericutes bacterium HGW-Tenericutes-8]